MQGLSRAGRRRERDGRACAARKQAEAGYATVDALVALVVLSSTLVFAIAAGHTGRQASDMALEMRQAKAVLEAALEQAPAEPGVTEARANGFAWRLVVGEPELVAGPTSLCRRDATATALRTHRHYALSTAVICASEKA